jgi:hypothetical protein
MIGQGDEREKRKWECPSCTPSPINQPHNKTHEQKDGNGSGWDKAYWLEVPEAPVVSRHKEPPAWRKQESSATNGNSDNSAAGGRQETEGSITG